MSIGLTLLRAAEPVPATVAVPVPSDAAIAPMQVQVVIPELDQLRDQLKVMERSTEELQKSNQEIQKSSEVAAQKFEAMAQQNQALSNVLTGLQQTLVNQREREVELTKANTAFNYKVAAGAAVVIFLVFLASYWFQLRCLNRVMEFSKTVPALHGPEPKLLEDTPTGSKLLNAMKVLEHRLEHIEHGGNGHGGGSLIEPSMVSGESEPATSSSMSLLLAKGQVLLETERLQEAVACFQEAITVDPENAEAHLKKGIALERMNRLEPALAAYEEALRLNPKRTVANVYKARVLAALHRYDEAISTYDSALGRNPQSKVETPIFAS
jgi:tetratricopeptide (TPR) repeat protein